MNSLIAAASRRIAVVVAVFGTLFTMGGTLTLAEHYAHAGIDAGTWVEGTGGQTLVKGAGPAKIA